MIVIQLNRWAISFVRIKFYFFRLKLSIASQFPVSEFLNLQNDYPLQDFHFAAAIPVPDGEWYSLSSNNILPFVRRFNSTKHEFSLSKFHTLY